MNARKIKLPPTLQMLKPYMKRFFAVSAVGALATIGAFVFSAYVAIAAHPAGPAGYWALDDGADPTADLSGHGNDGDVNGGAVFTGAGIAPIPSNVSALTFDGVDDFVEISNDDAVLDVTTPYSLSLWANVTDTATYRPLLFRGATNSNDIEVYVQTVTGDLIVAHNRVNGGTFDFVGFDDPPAGLFHLAVTYDGTNVQAYYNGVLAAVAQESTAVTAPEDTDKNWWIGKVDHSAFGGTNLFKGLIDEVQIYDRVLTSDEIEILSNTGDTLFVDDDGQIGFGSIDCDGVGVGAYTVIQDAIDAASSGDTVQVCPGTYDEQVVIDSKSLTLQGTGTSTTIIKPSSESILTSLYTTGTQAGAFFNGIVIASIIDVRNAGAAGVTIRDLAIDGEMITALPAGAGHVSGIVFGETGGAIDNVLVEDTKFVLPASVRTYSIWLDAIGATPVTVDVTDSTANQYGRNGINARGDSITVSFENNTIIGPGMVGPDQVPNGVLLIAGAGGEVKDNTISANHYTGATFLGSGVLLFQARDGITISGNEIFDTDDAVLLNATSMATIEDNNLHNNVKGIRLEAGAAGNSIGNNLIDTNSLYGIDVDDDPATPGNVALRNAITGNAAGVSNPNASSFDATCNWWGAVSGPGPVGPGTGDSVSTNVTFQPWLTTSDLLNGPCDGPLPDVTVTIVKYVDTVHANAINADNQSFPMQSSWDAENIGAGSGSFSLGPVGFNDPDPYEATTADMTAGADYSTSEDTSGAVVGTACSEGKPFALAGYSTGDTEAEAAANATSSSAILTSITTDKFVIVWNEKCEGTLIVKKVLVNDDGGSAATSTFTFKVNGGSSQAFEADGQNDIAVLPGPYSVVEDAAAGYTTTYSNSANGDANCDNLAVPDSATVICTITNNDTPPPPPAAPPANACDTPLVAPFGYTLINGSVGNDNLAIASFTMFVGNGGNDKVRAFGGSYIICTGTGKDIITLSGTSTVTIDAGSGDNTIAAPVNVVGFIKTGSGKDKIALGSGARTINAGDGKNIVTTTGTGDQDITTGTGDDKVTTGSGNDTISAGSGKNIIVSGAGGDSLTGLGGKDIMNGGPGIDTCDADGGTNIVVNCEL